MIQIYISLFKNNEQNHFTDERSIVFAHEFFPLTVYHLRRI